MRYDIIMQMTRLISDICLIFDLQCSDIDTLVAELKRINTKESISCADLLKCAWCV